MSRREILLESGTNEVEFIEFTLGGQSFGVNVSKVREIISYDASAITTLPEAYHSVMGMFILRDSTLPLINLGKHLEIPQAQEDADARKVVLVCEFNDLVNGFLVDGVKQIHRCSWNDMVPLSRYISQFGPSITSSVTIGETSIMLVDLEHILADIYPATRMVYRESNDPEHAADISERHQERAKAHFVLAEDSPIVRASVNRVTSEVGYTSIQAFDNGADAFNYVANIVMKAKTENQPLKNYLAGIITDIEMPKMDGLTFCRKIKEELGLTNLPVIIFSSLINEQMVEKCQSVGADGWANKLKIGDLVHILDEKFLGYPLNIPSESS
jgi:two-component system chemotaxis response regulator CheV